MLLTTMNCIVDNTRSPCSYQHSPTCLYNDQTGGLRDTIKRKKKLSNIRKVGVAVIFALGHGSDNDHGVDVCAERQTYI